MILRVSVRSIRFYLIFARFCTFFVHFYAFFAIKHYGTKIFIRLDSYMVLYIIPYRVNFAFCQQKFFCAFLSAKANTLLICTLRTKLNIWKTTTIYSLNIRVDKNISTKMNESENRKKMGKKHSKPYKNVFSVQVRQQIVLSEAQQLYWQVESFAGDSDFFLPNFSFTKGKRKF